MKTQLVASLASMIIAVSTNLVIAQDDFAASDLQDFDPKIATIQFMNHMNYVVYTLSSYKNPFVIEDEYRNLSPGNLYLDRIPDEKCVTAITEMLDTIRDMRVADDKLNYFLEGQARIAQQTRADLYLNIAKATVSAGAQAATLGASILKKDPQSIAELAKGIADESFGVYERYVAVQRQLERESKDYKFAYKQDKDRELHNQNKNQLFLQYQLSKQFGIEDKYRLSDENAKALVEVVKSSNKKGAFNRMLRMRKDQPAYDKFPMFWCYYASFALDSGDTKEALAACEHFKEINRFSLFKHDRMAALVAMTEIAAMLKANAIDEVKIRQALKTVQAYNYDGKDVDMAYFCASTYYSVLSDSCEAKEALEAAIGVLEEAAESSLTKYRDLFDSGETEKPWESNPPPVMTDLFRCHALLQTISDSGEDDSFREHLKTILDGSTAASMEKLFFVGNVRVKDLWKKARPDVEAIQLRYEQHDISKNTLVAFVPISWFALGDFPIRVDLLSNRNTVKTINEIVENRMIAFDRPASDLTFAKIEMKCPTKDLKGIDDYVLHLPHKSWPVAIHFRPPVSVDVKNAKFTENVSQFIPQRVEFMNNTFLMYEENENANAELFHVQLKDVVIPKELLKKAVEEKGRQAMLVDSKLYVEISRMGEVIWRSPYVDVDMEAGKETFKFAQDKPETSFALMWKPGDRIVVSVKVAEKAALVKASTTTAGGVAGALAGAGIGAVGAAAFSGGLGAPAGALIGAAIGLFGGAGIGAVIPVEGARTVVSFAIPSDEFGLDGKLEKRVFSADDIETVSVLLEGGQRQDAIAQNGLELQKKYVVRLRSVSISSKAPKFEEGEEYYMLVSLFGEEKPLEIDLPPIPADTIVPLETTLVLKNCGGESAVEIRRKRTGRDPLVFKAIQGPTNGSSWIFIGKSEDDHGSFVEFDTFPAGN